MLQFSEGEPEKVILVDIHYNGDSITFDIPGPKLRKGTFTGRISAAGIIGKLTSITGDLHLDRSKSYWD